MEANQVDDDWEYESGDDDWEYEPSGGSENQPVQQAPQTPWEKLQAINDSVMDRWTYKSEDPSRINPFTRNILSGATFGASENIPGLEISPSEKESALGVAGNIGGSLLPITGIFKAFSAPVKYLASKSPVMTKQLTSLGNILAAGATGATVKGAEDIAAGKGVDVDDMIEHGALWSTLDAALSSAGWLGRFGKSLLSKSKSTGQQPAQMLSKILRSMEEQGVPLDSSKKTAMLAMEALEKDLPQATKKLQIKAKPGESPVQALARESLQKMEGTGASLAEKEITSPDLDKKLAKIVETSKPEPLAVESPQKVIDRIAKEQLEQRIDTVAPKQISSKDLGEEIKTGIESAFKVAEEEYSTLYDYVRDGSKSIEHSPEATRGLVKSIIQKLESVKTRPEGYSKVINTLHDILHDIGPSASNVSLSTTMEVGRRLNKIINYDIIGSSIQNSLKPVVKSIKEEIRNSLGKKGSFLRDAFEKAEESFGKTAEKFGQNSILKARKAEAAEVIGSEIMKPSSLQAVKSVSSPELSNQIDRQILENLRKMSPQRAQTVLSELSPYMGKNAQSIGKDIVSGKATKGMPAKKAILQDIGNAAATGTRPTRALELWQTPKGRELVKNSLKGNPNRKEILDYLTEQTFYDTASQIVDKSGKINFKKLNEMMKDPQFLDSIRESGGETAVRFFKDLNHIKEGVERNINLFKDLNEKKSAQVGQHILNRFKNKKSKLSKEQKVALDKIEDSVLKEKSGLVTKKGEVPERGSHLLKKAAQRERPFVSRIDDYIKALGLPGKTIIGLLSAMQVGIPQAVGGALTLKLMYSLARSPSAQKAFRNASTKSLDTIKFLESLEKAGEALTDEKSPS